MDPTKTRRTRKKMAGFLHVSEKNIESVRIEKR